MPPPALPRYTFQYPPSYTSVDTLVLSSVSTHTSILLPGVAVPDTESPMVKIRGSDISMTTCSSV